MNAEFQWWLLLVGLVIGALLVFLVMVDFSRSAEEQTEREVARESDWIAGILRPTDGEIDAGLVQEILRLNREWLAGSATDQLAPAQAEPDAASLPPPAGSDPWQPEAGSMSDVESDGA